MAATWTSAARALGRDDGAGTVAFQDQYRFNGGRVYPSPTADQLEEEAHAVLDGLADEIPYPDLSGQWADALTPRSLWNYITGTEPDENPRYPDRIDDLCTEYEEAFTRAAEAELYRQARAALKEARRMRRENR